MPAKHLPTMSFPDLEKDSLLSILKKGSCKSLLIRNELIKWISDDVAGLTGMKESDLIGIPFTDLLNPADRKKFTSFINRLKEKPLEVQVRTTDHAGKSLLTIKAIQVPDYDQLFFLQIKESIRISAISGRLEDYSDMLPSIYNGIDTAIFVLDYTEEGEFIFRGLNPAHERISGMKSSVVEGKTPDELYPILPKEACEAVKANYQRCVDAGESIVYEEMIPMKGRNIWWLTRMTPLRNREGRIYRLIGSASDISELKENQQILSLRNEEILAQKEELERLYVKESQFSDQLDQKLKERTADLVERVKELNCQFEIDQHSMVDDFSELDFLKSSAESIKNGFLHPEFTEVKIEIDKIRISTTNNPKSHWVLNQSLKYKTLIGKILIYYTGKTDRNPFLEEERALAESLSVKIARVVYANRLTRELKSANEKHRLLNEKYIDQNNKLKKNNKEIRTEVARRKEKERAISEINQQFYSIFDNFPEILYVTDPSTYEVLFVNKTFRKLLGKDPLGKKCYEQFQGFKDPCPFCNNEKLLKNKNEILEWEHYNEKLDRFFIITDQMIKWPDGRDVRFEFAMDITRMKKAEFKYSNILKTSLDGFWITDMKGNILELNDAYARMSGYSSDQLKGMNVSFLDIDNSETAIKKIITELKKSGSMRYESRHRKADGRIMDVDISATVSPRLKDRVIIFVRDITDAKQKAIELRNTNQEYYSLLEEFKSQNEELRTTNESLQNTLKDKEIIESELRDQILFNQKIFNDSPMGLGVYNKEGECMKTNPRSAQMIGASVDQVLSQNFRNIKSWEQSGLKDAALRVLEKGGLERKEISVTSSFNKKVYIDCHFTRFFMNDEPHLLFIYNDISEQRKAEKNLHRSEQKYQELYKSMNEGVAIHEFIRDEQGNIIDYLILEVNPSFERILGLSSEQIRNKPATEAYGATAPPYLDIYSKILEVGESFQFEDYYEPMDKYFSIGVYSPGENMFATIFSDITEKKKAALAMKELNKTLEEKIKVRTYELEESNRKLSNLNSELESFSYSVSHDLRTPLRAIGGYSSILKEDYYDDLPEDARNNLDIIIRNSEKMSVLIDEILSFSRLNRQQLRLKKLNMKKIFEEVYSDLHTYTEGREIEFSMERLPRASGDEIMVRQVVSNLLSNALKYSAKEKKAVIRISGKKPGTMLSFALVITESDLIRTITVNYSVFSSACIQIVSSQEPE